MYIREKLSTISVADDAKSKLLGEIAEEYDISLQVLALEYTPKFHKQVLEEEDDSKAEVYKFTLTDADIDEKQEHSPSGKASRDHRKVYDEDDCIEEEVVEKHQRVFRVKETQEERTKSRRRSRSASLSSLIAQDTECWRYYYKGKRRRKKKQCGQCYHIVYNVFTLLLDQKGKGEGERSLKEAKHVHPKLPDYDQIVYHFTALRRQQKEEQNMH